MLVINKPKFIMMVGLPASGKSYMAEDLSKEHNAYIHSSDKIRSELLGDESNQDNNNVVFSLLHKRIKDDLRNGNSVIYDATNISYKRRRGFLSEIGQYNCHKVAVVVATPYDECLKRNQNRDRSVPEHVIKKMYMNWNTPYWYEGWDEIIILSNKPQRRDSPFKLIEDYKNYNQDSIHHQLSLGEHLEKTLEYVTHSKHQKTSIKLAAVLHDCGKPFTKSFLNSKGELTQNAHYYQHHCVGAYDSLCYQTTINPLDCSVLIQWHMQPYFWESDELNGEKQMNKYKNLWGQELFDDIMLLHQADKMAH